jgi:hypothetical protein
MALRRWWHPNIAGMRVKPGFVDEGMSCNNRAAAKNVRGSDAAHQQCDKYGIAARDAATFRMHRFCDGRPTGHAGASGRS